MKIYRRLTSILLLFLLGSVLGAEAVGFSDDHAIPCVEISVVENADFSHSDSQIAQQEISGIHNNHEHSKDSSSNCSDPCHTGQSHFGHSLYNTTQSQVSFPADSSAEVKKSTSDFAIEGPVLEGPRKPPRHS